MRMKYPKLALIVLLLCLLLGILIPLASADHTTGPRIEVADQVIFDATVSVEKAILIEPGWIVIYADDGAGAAGEVIGQRLLSPGANYNVDIPINADATTSRLYAMLHYDTGELGTFEFGTGVGQDLPVRDSRNASIVSIPFHATVAHVHDQLIEDDKYRASSVTVSAPSWLVIHAGDEQTFGAVLGQTLVEAGTTTDVMVELDSAGRTDILWPMLHVDDGERGVYEFGSVDGADAPIVVNGEVATAPIWTVPHIRVADQIVTRSDSMAANDQPTLVIDSVLAAEPGWLVVHQEARNGSAGQVAGYVAVPAGLSHGRTAISVELDPDLLTDNLWPMLHVDDGEIGEYEFGTVDGADAPVVVDGDVVTYPVAAAPSIVYEGWMPTNDSIIIAEALIDAPGWLVIHQDDGTGNIGTAIAQTQITPGMNRDIQVIFEDPYLLTDTLFPMLHYDTGAAGEFEFEIVEDVDVPVVVGEDVVAGAISIAEGDDSDSDGDDDDEQDQVPAATSTLQSAATPIIPTATSAIATVTRAATENAEDAPEFTIIEAAAFDFHLQTIVDMAVAARLTDVLGDPNVELTVFAPTDEAFAALPAEVLDTLMQDRELLTRVLTYHIVEGSITANLLTDMSIRSMEMSAPDADPLGSELDIQRGDDGSVTVNGANVIRADMLVRNGVIHVIDRVLLPPDVAEILDIDVSEFVPTAAATATITPTATQAATATPTIIAPTPVLTSGVRLTGTVNAAAAAVNLRSSADMDATVVTTIPNGTVVEVVGRSANSGWVLVNVNGMSGWIGTTLLSIEGDVSSVNVRN